MFLVGKPHGPSLTAASDYGQHPSRLFYVMHMISGKRLLVDTGPEVSVPPASQLDRQQAQHTRPLRAVNISPIAAYGQRTLTIDIGLRRLFRWVFIVADLREAILGADFLANFGLAVSMRGRSLKDATTSFTIQTILSSLEASPMGPLAASSRYDATFAEYPAITRPCNTEVPAKHTVTHHIITNGPPVFARHRRLFGERLHIARKEFEYMLELGIIRPSSNWALPLHVVPKKDPND